MAIDVTQAKDIPEAELAESGDIRVGGGPVLSRGAPTARAIFDLLEETASRSRSLYGIEVVRGSTHTDADAYHLSRAGIATGLVSVATRYIHTPTELVVARGRREHRTAARRIRAAAPEHDVAPFPAPRGAAGRMQAWTSG